jgi:hypothetical protein
MLMHRTYRSSRTAVFTRRSNWRSVNRKGALKLIAPEGAHKVHVDASASEATGKVVTIQIDVTSLPEEERGVAPVVLGELRTTLEGAGHQVSDEPTPGAIVLRARLRHMEAGNRNYGIHFEFMDGDRAAPAMEWVECIFCTEARVLERIRESAPDLLAAVERQVPKTSAESDTGDETGGEPIDDVGPGPAKVKPIGPLGFAGIGVATLGLGAVVWGAVDLGRGRVYDNSHAGIGTRRPWTDFGPRGTALLGAGIGGVVLGGALLVTDLAIRSKKRKSLGTSAGVVTPMLSPQSLGLGWTQRF